MDFFSLRGKRAIVTGGNTGLGQAFALALAKGGVQEEETEAIAMITAALVAA